MRTDIWTGRPGAGWIPNPDAEREDVAWEGLRFNVSFLAMAGLALIVWAVR